MASRALARFMVGRYDLLWYFGIRPWVLAGGLGGAPTILDFVDLDDQKLEARLSVPRPPAAGPAALLRRTAGRVASDQQVRRWRRLHRQAGERVDLAVVCSELDAERATAGGVPRVAVIPNGYPRVGRPRGRVPVGSPPTVLFPGTLRYPPNADAARYLAAEVGPLLRTLVPDVRIRLVGRGTEALSGLDDPPRLTMVGQVEDIQTELAVADIVVVPLRFGSGTRLKILEAFAHRIPVVSTTLGAEGLEVEDGVHLLIGDTPADMAAACARLLTDEALRAELASRAHQHYLDRFESQIVEGRIASLAVSVVESHNRMPASIMMTR
jgi:glycosyltransferase involved in cell wall biosynthesis